MNGHTAEARLPGEAEPAPDAAAQTGARLRAARESQGLSVQDVARNLRLSPQQVQALESGDYHRLPGSVFVRGFLRNYARLLRLDPEVLVASQPSLAPAARVMPDVPPAVGAPFSPGPSLLWVRYAAFALLLAVPVGIYLAFGDRTEAPAVAPVTPPAFEVAAKGAETDPGGRSEPGASTLVEKVPAAAESPAPVAGAKPKAGDRVIRLSFERESWVEVRDRDGNKVYSQLNAAGTSQTISGTPPLSLVIGNAAGVRMTVNDEPYDLAPYVKIDVARLTLD